MSVSVKVFTTDPDITMMDTVASSSRDAIGLIRLTFNRESGDKGNLFVLIDGKHAMYNVWFMSFHKWFGSGWCQINNPVRYFEMEE